MTTTALDLDLKKLEARAFDRAEWAEEVLRRYHAAAPRFGDSVAPQMRLLYNWMFVPPTLWPFNIQDVLSDCLALIAEGKHLNSRHLLVIDLLPESPDEAVCAAVAAHECQIQKGSYENVARTQAKYAQNELAIKTDLQLQRQWARIKTIFSVRAYCDHKGVIRRTMSTVRRRRAGKAGVRWRNLSALAGNHNRVEQPVGPTVPAPKRPCFWAAASSERLQIRHHDAAHTINAGVLPKFFHRETLLAPAVTQSFHCHVSSDLVPKFEAINDGAGHIGDGNFHALDLLHLNSYGQSFAGELHDAQAQPIRFWLPFARRPGQICGKGVASC